MNSEVVLNGITVGLNRPAYIIAEIGSNHLGDIEEAKRLMSMARDAGANAAKFQKRDNATLYTRDFYSSPYNSENAYADTYGAHRDALEFSLSQFLELQEFANFLGIALIATPFDLPSVDFLDAIDVPFYKVASGSISNPLLLRKIAGFRKPVVASFGGATPEEVERVVVLFDNAGTELILLHCVAGYPPRPDELTLETIDLLRETYPDHVIGFSDHDDGISMALVAWAKGARVFEKHITMSHTNKGTDHAFSLEYMGLRTYTGNLHEAEKASIYQSQPLESERSPLYKMRSAVYTTRDIEVGERLTESDLVLKSPAEGLEGWSYDDLLGTVVREPIKKEEPLEWRMFEGGR
jgi:N-acetylneuraminate synthase/sialic acid synthase